jgi:hypothetical protein
MLAWMAAYDALASQLVEICVDLLVSVESVNILMWDLLYIAMSSWVIH